MSKGGALFISADSQVGTEGERGQVGKDWDASEI